MNIETGPLLDFEKVTLLPHYSDIKSRLEVDLSTTLTDGIKLSHPIISTNMSSVTASAMMEAMTESGSVGILHRFLNIDALRVICGKFRKYYPTSPLVVSVGVKDSERAYIEQAMEYRPNALMIDIAHGDSIQMYETIKHIQLNFPDVEIIAGNFAGNSETYHRIFHAGVDAVRVGIAGGHVCETRNVTGHHMPTLEAIKRASKVRAITGTKCRIIGDGGFRTSGDIVKALAMGADCVTVGYLLAGADEAACASTGETHTSGTRYLSGMSSKMAQEAFNGPMRTGIAPEGRTVQVEGRGPVEDILNDLLGGIRSGCTYSGARNLKELNKKAIFKWVD